MTPAYLCLGPQGWLRRLGPVGLYLSDEGGRPNRAQAAVADRMTGSLPALRDMAARYLDLFVDRAKACGRAEEPWWLDEIDFRAHAGTDPVRYALVLTLQGDDGGLWTVDMQTTGDGDRPFRFERLQG